MDESQVMAGWEERRAMTMEQALAYVRHGEPRHGPKASSAADG
jgi:hypothetical protein